MIVNTTGAVALTLALHRVPLPSEVDTYRLFRRRSLSWTAGTGDVFACRAWRTGSISSLAVQSAPGSASGSSPRRARCT